MMATCRPWAHLGRWMLLSVIGGCHEPEFRGGGPRLLPPNPAAPLSRTLEVSIDRSARVEIEIRDARGRRRLVPPQTAREHRVPLLGFRPDDVVDLVVTAIDRRGGRSAPWPLSFQVGSLPHPFPTFDVLEHQPQRMEDGLRLLPLSEADPQGAAYLVALDQALEVVWVWRAPRAYGPVRVTDAGTILGLSVGAAWEITPLGEILHQWGPVHTAPAPADTWVPVAVNPLHHEIVRSGDGALWSLTRRRVQVDDFPCDYTMPSASCGPATLIDGVVVRIDDARVEEWSLLERLDPFRISYDALEGLPQGAADWAHVNGIAPRPDGSIVVSVRNQDALVALDADGVISWILGDPAGWGDKHADLLLVPQGELDWPYHAHGPSVDDEGTLWMFDNGGQGRTPYGLFRPEHVELVSARSRVVGYQVDEEAGTVSEVASFEDTATGPLFSRVFGSAEVLPGTGNVLGVYGRLWDEDGTPYLAMGFGAVAVRLVEWTRGGDLVADIRLRSDVAEQSDGWHAYRAIGIPSLYPTGVEKAVP